ncbi:hypothetical protein [Saccharicrinis sp. GN24d3]|uniref:hypothetical protein n=1 Tax=Saccharicrinis sp. GN24d3 TaxID=3458416 RepID=UPI0040364625
MERSIRRATSVNKLNKYWDDLTSCYFQKKDFLLHLQKYNPCNQRYYELYIDECLKAGAVVYSIKMDLLTFSKFTNQTTVHIIGLPVSVSASGLIGETCEFTYLSEYILKKEKGFILALNLINGFTQDSAINMRTLPSVVFKKNINNWEEYQGLIRSKYRRRLNNILQKFSGVECFVNLCSDYTEEHHELYLQILERTKTKLETLTFDFFRNLPDNFQLTSHYAAGCLLCWNIICFDNNRGFFFFGGLNYELRNKYQAYHNNLISILKSCFTNKCELIDLGQTAEIPKMRLGGEIDERHMFLYHNKKVIMGLLRIFQKQISYNHISKKTKVFSNNN